MGLVTRYLVPFVETHLLEIAVACLVALGIHQLVRRMRTQDQHINRDPLPAAGRDAGESKPEKGSKNVIGKWFLG